jgi:hypothetical protein
MSESRNRFIETNKNEIAVQAASLTILPAWYPFFAKSLYQRSQILESKVPGDLSHSTFFLKKHNYYRGISANLTMQPLFPLAEWLLTTLLKKTQQINQRDPVLAEKFAAGFITGSTTALVANPYEATVIASQKHSEPPYKSFMRILRTSGVKGFYTGILPMSIRNGTFLSGLFVTSPELKKLIETRIPGSGTAHYVASTALGSAIPATIFTGIAIPLDLAAVMRQSDPNKEKFHSTIQALKQAHAKHGIAAFKAGALLRLFACVIEMTGFNLLNDGYSHLLSDAPRPK